MSEHSIDDFKSQLKGGGARPNLFKVTMGFPTFNVGGDVALCSYMIKASSLPASTISVIEMGYRGRKLKLHGDRTFEPWKVTVINDVKMDIRGSFERWMDNIHNHGWNYGAQLPAIYHADMAISQLDHTGNAISKQYTFSGAWPSSISAIEVNWDTNDSVEEFEVEFAYQYWVSDTTNPRAKIRN